MSYFGDVRLGDTIDLKFTSRRFSTGAPYTLAGSPVISAYVGNGTTEITAGITLSVDFDGVTGLNNVRVVASNGNGFATATNVMLVITTGTVDSVSVVGEVVGSFSIECRSAIMPTTATRTLDVSATGEAGIDWANVGSPSTSVNLSATTTNLVNTVTTYTGNTPQTGDSFARIGATGSGLSSLAPASTALSTATWTGTLATNLGTLAGHDPGTTIGTSTLTQTQVTGGAYNVQSSSCVLGDARIANLDTTVSSRGTSTLTQSQVTGGTYALNSSSFAFDAALDFSTAQKTSIGTAVAASAVASVTGNVGGTVAGIAGTTQTLDALQTALNSTHGGGSWATATSVTVSDKTGFSLAGTQTFSNTGTWTGNIVGTVSAVTNLSNAPTAGDFTTAMKSSLDAATPALDLTAAVPTSNTANTIGDCLNAARAQGFGKWVISGTTLTLYAADGTTAVRTFTLDSAIAPTSRT